MAPNARLAGDLFLGIEGSGTRTVALLADGAGRQLGRWEAGPANLRLSSDRQLVKHFRALSARMPRPSALGIGLAGAWNQRDCERIRAAAARVWKGVPCWATSDLETALAAGGVDARAKHQVLIVSGTGSCCYGKAPGGREVKVGGWGHLLGDKGSGYEIGLRALKAVVYYYGRDGDWPRLGARLLTALQLNEPDDLIGWAHGAGKAEIARLAREVFSAWQRRDKIAGDILMTAASDLSRDAIACARRLAPRGGRVHFILAGGNLLKQRRFAAEVVRQVQHAWRGASIETLAREGAWGAVELARNVAGAQATTPATVFPGAPKNLVQSARLSPTEQRHPRSMHLDQMSVSKAVRLMLSEDARVPKRVLAERQHLERAVRLIVRAFRRGGRLFYVGAGTSGRLGVLDASECPPTFRTPPEMVQGIIAGGETALRRSVEGAEDDSVAGGTAVAFRGLGPRDVVVGIAASGTTPYVWGALAEARRRGARTILVCFNPFLEIPRALRPTIVIAPNLGPELLTGSTRLKAGTATKLILNLFTTLAMVQLGKVMGNLMIDLHPANVKLRQRAIRIVRELGGVDDAAARTALERHGWHVKTAIARLARPRIPRRGGIYPANNNR